MIDKYKKFDRIGIDFVGLCNGSTLDSGSSCGGSNPSPTDFYLLFLLRYK